MDELMIKVLSAYGLPGLVILVLGWTVRKMYKDGYKVNEIRLAERDVLIKALENNTQATRENAAAIIARNLITEEQGKSIERQAAVFELFVQRSDLHDDALKDRLQEFKLVIDAIAEASRTNTAILRDVRDIVNGGGEGRRG